MAPHLLRSEVKRKFLWLLSFNLRPTRKQKTDVIFTENCHLFNKASPEGFVHGVAKEGVTAMRVMIDTNIISAALFPNGRTAQAFRKALVYPFKALICDYVVEELHDKFSTKFADRSGQGTVLCPALRPVPCPDPAVRPLFQARLEQRKVSLPGMRNSGAKRRESPKGWNFKCPGVTVGQRTVPCPTVNSMPFSVSQRPRYTSFFFPCTGHRSWLLSLFPFHSRSCAVHGLCFSRSSVLL